MRNDYGDGFLVAAIPGITITALLVMFWSPEITPQQVEYAEQVCASNGGWKAIYKDAGPHSEATVYCKNGAQFYGKITGAQ